MPNPPATRHHPSVQLTPPAGRSGQVAGIDIFIMAYLLGEIVSPNAPETARRSALLDGLSRWLGAGAWFWILAEDRQNGESVIVASLQDGLGDGRLEEAWRALAGEAATEPGHAVYRTRQREDGRHAWAGILREPGQPPFTAREVRLAVIILEEVEWLFGEDPAASDVVVPLLSPRQQEVLDLLLRGMDRKRVAAQLGITPNTLSTHVKEIYRRLGVNSLTALLKPGTPDTIPPPPSP